MKKWTTKHQYKHSYKGFKKHCKNSHKRKVYSYKKHIKKFGLINIERKTLRAIKTATSKYFSEMIKSTHKSKAVSHNNLSYKLPRDFCFIHSPSSTLKSIHRIHQIVKEPNLKNISIDHSKVKNYNLTSEVLLGLCVETERTQRRLNKKASCSNKIKKLRIIGTFPDDSDHKQLISEIGVVKEIGANTNTPASTSTKRPHLFSKKSIGPSIASAYSDDDKTRAADQFTRYVNKCIKDHRLSLTDEAMQQLLITISEVLDNAERHASQDARSHIWHAKGYLNSESNRENLEISLFNFGRTIASTFDALPDGTFGKKQVMEYAKIHSSSDFSEEQLITVAALQHRYSSKNRDDRDTNGQGTICLIEFFEHLCDNLSELPSYERIKPEMSIVSGMTHILFDGTYRLSPLSNYTKDNAEQLIIAFNKENSLKLPPDPICVKSLTDGAYFPGVAISIRVPLKEEENKGDYSGY